jgi:hypothetical protein
MGSEKEKEEPQKDAVRGGVAGEEKPVQEETPALSEQASGQMKGDKTGGEQGKAVPAPKQSEFTEEAKNPEEQSKDTDAGEQIEEEVVLDEVLGEEEEASEPDGSREPAEEPLEETDTEEKGTGSPEASPEEGQNRKGMFALLRKKWVLVPAGGFFLMLGLAFGPRFFGGDHGKLLRLGSLLGGHAKENQGLVQSVLRPFFVPLPEDSGKLLVKLVISVRWSPEILVMYRKNQIRVRDEVYQYLLRTAGSGEKFDEEKSALVSELDRVFEHALAIRDIEVRVDEIAPI